MSNGLENQLRAYRALTDFLSGELKRERFRGQYLHRRAQAAEGPLRKAKRTAREYELEASYWRELYTRASRPAETFTYPVDEPVEPSRRARLVDKLVRWLLG